MSAEACTYVLQVTRVVPLPLTAVATKKSQAARRLAPGIGSANAARGAARQGTSLQKRRESCEVRWTPCPGHCSSGHVCRMNGGWRCLGCFSQLICWMDAPLNAAQCKPGWLAAESALRDCIGQGAPPEIKPLSGVLERLKSRAAAVAARWPLASLLAPAAATKALSHYMCCWCVGRLSITGRCNPPFLLRRRTTSLC